MARKNLLLEVVDDAEPVAVAPPASTAATAPLRPAAVGVRGAPGMVGRSLAALATKATSAEHMEAQLTAGQTVVELDPAVVDPSFVIDRMMEDDDGLAILRQAIAAQGQNSPILVRPHPTGQGRYQAAFGHRRLRVAKDLGRTVRAVVKQLSDEDLVLAQGQENSARVDLSYIERALFAKRLEDLKYGREIIMAALGIDKAAASKMISVASRIPAALIEAIGPAPAIGRPRWIELADQFERKAMPGQLTALLENHGLRMTGDSDRRFDQVFRLMSGTGREPGAHGDARYWSSPTGDRLVKITYNTRACAMVFDEKNAPGFGDFVATQMDRLFADYVASDKRKPKLVS
jgi:ParB family transcriptional regulator, chromosome partitioning protein